LMLLLVLPEHGFNDLLFFIICETMLLAGHFKHIVHCAVLLCKSSAKDIYREMTPQFDALQYRQLRLLLFRDIFNCLFTSDRKVHAG